jgi:hypothetical protein
MNDPTQAILNEAATLSADLETKRESFFRIFLMGAPMSFALICAIAAMNTKEGVFPWLFVALFSVAAVFIEFHIINYFYRQKTKAAFLHRIAESLGLLYAKGGAFPLEDMADHKILPPHDVRHIEDGFSGEINGVPLAFQEIVLSDRVKDENNNVHNEMVFWGLVIRIGIGKILNAHTVVMPRNTTLTFFRSAFSSFERVKLVSPKFEDRFDVLSTDQVEARYVLDPAFMERVMEAGDLLGSKWLEISFRGSEIAFAVQRPRPMFEIGFLWKKLSHESLQDVADELKAVLGLIDALKLNPHTGLGAPLPRTRGDE